MTSHYTSSLIRFDFQFQNQGEVWRGTLPSVNKRNLKPLDELAQKKFTTVVLLLSDEECHLYRKLNLREAYLQKGFEVIHLPIEDHSVPKMSDMRQTVKRIVSEANAGKKILVHCMAGNGRTGTVLGCIAREQLGLSGKEAIEMIKSVIPRAFIQQAQRNLVLNYCDPNATPSTDPVTIFTEINPYRSADRSLEQTRAGFDSITTSSPTVIVAASSTTLSMQRPASVMRSNKHRKWRGDADQSCSASPTLTLEGRETSPSSSDQILPQTERSRSSDTKKKIPHRQPQDTAEEGRCCIIQ